MYLFQHWKLTEQPTLTLGMICSDPSMC